MNNSSEAFYLEYLQGWEDIYAVPGNPFDVTDADEWISGLEAEGKIRGVVLDAGCGGGHNSLYLAAKGYEAMGVDISPRAIRCAEEKAKERRTQNVRFLATNLCEPFGCEDLFDSVVDIGCFHSLHEEDQKRYADVLWNACRSGATLFLRTLNFVNTDHVPASERASAQERQIRVAFSDGWRIETIELRELEVKTPKGERLRTGAWFARIEKVDQGSAVPI